MKILVPCSYYVFGWNRGGIFSVANHFKRIFGEECDLIKFGSLEKENTVNELPYSSVSDFSSYDCTFLPDVRGFSGLKEALDLSKFPRPIIARVDDYGDTDFKNLKQWSKDIDVFWCFKNKMYEYVKENTDKKVVISGLPYLPVASSSHTEEKTIFSVCRLDPIKRIETLIDVSSRVKGKIILWLYTMDFLRNYSKTIESLMKEQSSIEYVVSDSPFEEKNIFEALSRANSYYSATTWGSGTGVEYVALEAINNLCVPVIRSNMRSDYVREKYRGFFWEYHDELIKAIERSFLDRDMLYYNLLMLRENYSHFRNMFLEIVSDWHH